MEIVEVQQNWKKDTVRIELTLSNICNYKCWYCFPGCNEGTFKWPEFDTYVKNLSYLLDYYLEHTDKKKFDFHVLGGEATHWKRFFDLIEYFKTRYNCIFTLTTNGSKSIQWWEKAAPYLDYVSISVHHEYCKPEHIKNVADFLYEKNVIVAALMLMDPFEWDKCMNVIEDLKTSKHKWSIRYVELIIQESVKYTEEQKKILSTLRARRANIWWFLKNNKSYRSKVKVFDTTGKRHKVSDEKIILERMNQFNGWECNLGVDWIAIKMDGTVSGICGNGLFDKIEKFNINDPDFTEKFKPNIVPTTCQQHECWCMFEANMSKRKVSDNTKKIIPIYAN
jgi:MoaA/NifB/PqqE/SkfB family radical SAM enzyme